MDIDYQASGALKYLEFLDSKNGQIQKKILSDEIRGRLPNNHNLLILDAACGPGWLAADLKKDFAHISACDSSKFFIDYARSFHLSIDFKTASLDKPLPYPHNTFDVVILNMSAPDLENLESAMKNLSAALKPGGKLIMTLPNPKYSFPAAVWKRSLADVLLRRKPKLQFKNPPQSGSKIKREFGSGIKINSYFYSEDTYLSEASAAGLKLSARDEVRSQTDSTDFDLNYQLYRYPLILLLKFTK